jgi:formate dehydrogenase major subunit
MPSIAGMTWERLETESAVTYPCEHDGDPGERVVFTEHFPTPTGRARLVPADIIPAAERPDNQYPFVLITGRQLEHWHTGSMTRRTEVLDAIEPAPIACVHPLDIEKLGLKPGDRSPSLRVAGRCRYSRVPTTERRPARSSFRFCYYEAAANLLTNPVLDPFGKIPEFKYCAVQVIAGGRVPETTGYKDEVVQA